ncbi:EF-hand domain-containing protein [Roseovarius pelagicus]|uniref:Calcium-binding protein n=1 Tax=Roseovarius pelagicus TaxID=2980108 RepID=A0ABY6DJY5_9RHOB|nr:calcium-binding protein [Roseovarius pelagicus]UXX85258.1 calcium-binding protein [Roseovarius pelagicus]
MSQRFTLVLSLIAATGLSDAAYAQNDHGHGAKSKSDGGGMMMQGGGSGMMGDMSGMMEKMHRMHGNEMGGMGRGMMDGTMMQMLDADGDGNVTPQEMRTQMQAKLTEYDSDGDGTLSISEFETLHSAMIREKMVDRFQHLDADGDGAITSDEMAAPAKKMERMKKMHSGMGQMQGQPGSGQGMDSEMNKADDTTKN